MSGKGREEHIADAIQHINCVRTHLYGTSSAVGRRELEAAREDLMDALDAVNAAQAEDAAARIAAGFVAGLTEAES